MAGVLLAWAASQLARSSFESTGPNRLPLLGTRTGDLLLYLWQVDYADGGAAVLSSHEYHLADAFDFSVVRRGPGRRFS